MAKIIDSFSPSEEVKTIFSRVNFVPKKIIFAEPESLRLIIRGKIGREEVVFKSCDNSRRLKAENIIKEGQVGRILNQHYGAKRKKIPSFEIIDFAKTKNISWLVRKYYHGGVLGTDSNNFLDRLYIDRFTHLNKKYVNQQKIFVKKIIDNVAIFRHISKGQVKFSSSNIRRFADNFTNYQISKLSDCLDLDLKIQQNFFQQNRKLFFSSENIQATVGDMAPTNIFIDKNNKVIFFDLEWFCFDNYLTDVTFFWLLLWRYPDWQNEVIDAAIKTEKDKLCFQLNVIRIVLTLFGLIFADENNESDYFRQIKQLCQKHPWKKYLAAIAESYETLIK